MAEPVRRPNSPRDPRPSASGNARATPRVRASSTPPPAEIERNRELQRELQREGLYAGDIDGVLGPDTKGAIRQLGEIKERRAASEARVAAATAEAERQKAEAAAEKARTDAANAKAERDREAIAAEFQRKLIGYGAGVSVATAAIVADSVAAKAKAAKLSEIATEARGLMATAAGRGGAAAAAKTQLAQLAATAKDLGVTRTDLAARVRGKWGPLGLAGGLAATSMFFNSQAAAARRDGNETFATVLETIAMAEQTAAVLITAKTLPTVAGFAKTNVSDLATVRSAEQVAQGTKATAGKPAPPGMVYNARGKLVDAAKAAAAQKAHATKGNQIRSAVPKAPPAVSSAATPTSVSLGGRVLRGAARVALPLSIALSAATVGRQAFAQEVSRGGSIGRGAAAALTMTAVDVATFGAGQSILKMRDAPRPMMTARASGGRLRSAGYLNAQARDRSSQLMRPSRSAAAPSQGDRVGYTTIDGRTVTGTDAQVAAWRARRN